MSEREFTFTYDIEYTAKIYWSKRFEITAETLADAKAQAEEEARAAEGGAYFYQDIGIHLPIISEVESADVEMDSLVDEETGDIHESLAIEPGDDAPFADEEGDE